MFCKIKAFTLAEVLITLGIIGVVAALIIPAFIQKYRNHVVETRLQKVYSVMNQAILRSEVDNGPKEYWDFKSEIFWEKYFAPYLVKVTESNEIQDLDYNYRGITFTDGSMLVWKSDNGINSLGNKTTALRGMNSDYFFFPDAKNYSSGIINDRKYNGSYYFSFRFSPMAGMNYHTGKGFEPYKFQYNEAPNSLRTGHMYSCEAGGSYHSYCTALIQHNGWKIPKDYPFKVR